jgi:hypothetical protein
MFILQPLGVIQKISTITVSQTSIDATPIYTCPAGKKAVVTYTIQLIAYGANSVVNIEQSGTSIDQWSNGDPNFNSAPYRVRKGSVQLNAGDTLYFHGNVADNATMNYTISTLELPI